MANGPLSQPRAKAGADGIRRRGTGADGQQRAHRGSRHEHSALSSRSIGRSGFSIVMIAGVRHAFAMPVDLPANWIFRLTREPGPAPMDVRGRALRNRLRHRADPCCSTSPWRRRRSAGRWPLRMTALQLVAALVSLRDPLLQLAAASIHLLVHAGPGLADRLARRWLAGSVYRGAAAEPGSSPD